MATGAQSLGPHENGVEITRELIPLTGSGERLGYSSKLRGGHCRQVSSLYSGRDAGKGSRLGVFPSVNLRKPASVLGPSGRGGVFLLWILAQSLRSLVLQVFWGEVGV